MPEVDSNFSELLEALAMLEGRWLHVNVTVLGDLPHELADFRGLGGKLDMQEKFGFGGSYTVAMLPVGEGGRLYFRRGYCHLDDLSEKDLYVVADLARITIEWEGE
jgi:hypothetical protein